MDNSEEIVVLVGNGLGRAFDNEGFRTESILQRLFSEESRLAQNTKNFFNVLFPFNGLRGEEELGKIEGLIESLNILQDFPISNHLNQILKNRIKSIDSGFLQELKCNFRSLKISFLKEIKEKSDLVIRHSRFSEFRDRFHEFVLDSKKVNIATLNYDSILNSTVLFYKDHENFDDITKKYVDGFYNSHETSRCSKLREEDRGSIHDRHPSFSRLHSKSNIRWNQNIRGDASPFSSFPFLDLFLRKISFRIKITSAFYALLFIAQHMKARQSSIVDKGLILSLMNSYLGEVIGLMRLV